VVFAATRLATLNFRLALAGANAEPATRPSFKVFRQNFSKSGEGWQPLGGRAALRNPRLPVYLRSCERIHAGNGCIERRDQRLNHADRTIESARIAQVPGSAIPRRAIAEFGSLVKMRTDVNVFLTASDFFFSSNLILEANRNRAARYRLDWPRESVALDFAGIDIGAQFAQRFQ